MADDLTPTRIVYLGPVVLEGNKPGELWALEEAARAAGDADALRKVASPFGKGRRSSTVGAVYEAPARVEDGRLTSINRGMTYRAMLDTDAIVAMALRAKGLQAEQVAAREEAKIRRSGPASEQLEHLAHIVAAASITDQEHVIRAISSELRRRALEIWRKGRK